MSNQQNTVALDLKAPFTLTQMPNGGWTIKQLRNTSTSWAAPPAPASSPASLPPEPPVVGAYSTAEDLLAALALAMNPPEPEKELRTEVPPFDLTNAANEWMPMVYAPRTGVYVRIEDEDGNRHRPMKFTAPCWWDAPNGELRLADSHEDGSITRAVKWRPLDAEDDARYNNKRVAARPPLPAAFR